MLKGFEIKKGFICSRSLFRYYIKQIDSMLPCVCSVIDHRRRQIAVRTSVTHSAIVSCANVLFLPHFDVICDLLLNRRMATRNLFVKQMTSKFGKKTPVTQELLGECALTFIPYFDVTCNLICRFSQA